MSAYWGDNPPPRITWRQLPAIVVAGLGAGILAALLTAGPTKPSQPAPPAHGCVMWAHGADIMCAQP